MTVGLDTKMLARYCTRLASFDDKKFMRRAQNLGLVPTVSAP